MSEAETPDVSLPLADVARELHKLREVLESVQTYFFHFGTMNQTLHLSPSLLQTPLAAKVDAAVNWIDKALERWDSKEPVDEGEAVDVGV